MSNQKLNAFAYVYGQLDAGYTTGNPARKHTYEAVLIMRMPTDLIDYPSFCPYANHSSNGQSNLNNLKIDAYGQR